MWDGEGYDAYAVSLSGEVTIQHRYMLFGCSTFDYITGYDLGTKECLDLMLRIERETPDAFHVGFVFEYDVNMILKDLPWRMLAVLRETGRVKWNGYHIKHTPHKMFQVSKDGVVCCIYDCFGYFHSSYLAALDKYRIGDAETLAIVTEGKAQRGKFNWFDIAYVVKYWKAEISLGPPLMDEIRKAAYGGGFRISEWHGPGALAAYAIKHNDVGAYKSRNFKPHVMAAIRAAYAGGRFQAWQCGEYDGPVWTYDINSAYIYAAAQLPNLAKGTWSYVDPKIVRDRGTSRFGLYHLEFDARGQRDDEQARNRGLPQRPYPLFCRDKRGGLSWPNRVQGWYWSPEASEVIGSKHCTIHAALEFKDDGTYPFKWVNQYFHNRLLLQRRNDPAEKAFKWALAAIYGAFARRVGWNKKRRSAPRTHELAWAGYITSYCRAMVYNAASYAASKGGLVSIDTDGITSTVPIPERYLPNGLGEELGEWKEEQFTGLFYWQNGIYWMRDTDNEWSEAKSRGIPKGRISLDLAREALGQASFHRPYRPAKICMQRTRFIGYRQALRQQYKKWRQWETEPYEVIMGGNGKGCHVPELCRKCRYDDARQLHTIHHMKGLGYISEPHKLPWLEPETELPDLATIKQELIFGDDDL